VLLSEASIVSAYKGAINSYKYFHKHHPFPK
jgi:hypothetical protein